MDISQIIVQMLRRQKKNYNELVSHVEFFTYTYFFSMEKKRIKKIIELVSTSLIKK